MADFEQYPAAFLPIIQRIRASFAKTLNEERARAVEEGLPRDMVLDGTLNTLLWFGARIACRIIFPAEDPDSAGGRARVLRVQVAVSQALLTIMTHEKEGPSGPETHTGPDQRAGHA